MIIESACEAQDEEGSAAVEGRIIVVEGTARGDGIQAEKAGLLELADLIVVNKCDIDGADKAVNDLTISLTLSQNASAIEKVSALTGEGTDNLASILMNIPARANQRAKNRQRLLMAHEHKLTSNPNFETVLDRMNEEGFSLERALRELDD